MRRTGGVCTAQAIEVEVEVDEVEERASMGGQGRPRRVQPAGPLGRRSGEAPETPGETILSDGGGPFSWP